MSNINKLIEEVIANSVAENWRDAVIEWEIIDCKEAKKASAFCVCGKENLRYLYRIKNIKNENEIYPIGSTCINKFGRKELKEKADVQKKIIKLYRAFKSDEYIEFTSEYFSRKILKELFEQGTFIGTKWNQWNGEKDYLFLLKKFNQNSKPTVREQKKISALMIYTIKPFVIKKIESESIISVKKHPVKSSQKVYN